MLAYKNLIYQLYSMDLSKKGKECQKDKKSEWRIHGIICLLWIQERSGR